MSKLAILSAIKIMTTLVLLSRCDRLMSEFLACRPLRMLHEDVEN